MFKSRPFSWGLTTCLWLNHASAAVACRQSQILLWDASTSQLLESLFNIPKLSHSKPQPFNPSVLVNDPLWNLSCAFVDDIQVLLSNSFGYAHNSAYLVGLVCIINIKQMKNPLALAYNDNSSRHFAWLQHGRHMKACLDSSNSFPHLVILVRKALGVVWV